MAKETGGAAFPGIYKRTDAQFGQYEVDVPGMTLRDYFAAKAMQINLGFKDWANAEIARDAYKLADAMIAERAKGE